MSKISHAAGEAILSQFRDATPEGAEVQWRHYDVICRMRGDEAIAAAKASDFRIRAFHENREQLLNDVANTLRKALPEERSYPPRSEASQPQFVTIPQEVTPEDEAYIAEVGAELERYRKAHGISATPASPEASHEV